MTRKSWIEIATLAWLAATGISCASPVQREGGGGDPDPGLPPDYQQVLERGRIAAIDDPQFVSAEQAEIQPDAWVLGVVAGGQPRAYSLNLLNRHEVVNDQAEGESFAAVW